MRHLNRRTIIASGLAAVLLLALGYGGSVSPLIRDAVAQVCSGNLTAQNNLAAVCNKVTALTNLLPSQSGQSGKVLGTNGTAADWVTVGGGDITGVEAGTGLAGGGTSGDVSLAVSYGTSSGTATQGNDARVALANSALTNQSANCIVAGPSSGGSADATCRPQVMLDLPTAAKDSGWAFETGDAAGSALTTASCGYGGANSRCVAQVPFACTISRVDVLGDASGSVSIEVAKTTQGSYDGGATHPATGDKISASDPVVVTTSITASKTSFTSWTLTVSKGDIIALSFGSISSFKWLKVTFFCDR